MPDKKDVIALLDNIADIMDFKGENKFKIGAFRNGAISIRRFEGDFAKAVEKQELDKIKGIGKGLQAVIYEYCESGESLLYKELKEGIPDGIEQLLGIKGLGAKKINQLYNELGISSIGELEYACRENRLALLKGFGEATQNKILSEIDRLRYHSKFVLLNTAEEFADEILLKLNSVPGITKSDISGELRRGMEIVSSLNFVLLVNDKKKFLQSLKKSLEYKLSGEVASVKSNFSVPVKLHFTYSADEYISTLFTTTGSAEFLGKLRAEPGKLQGGSEEEIFRSLKSPYVIPGMREEEYFRVKKKSLLNTPDLSGSEFKGLLHFHTVFSDGRNTLDEMINAAVHKGYTYAAVCDHSKSAFYANGLSEERILNQKEEVEKMSSEKNIYIFQGIESDILGDGKLDYTEDFLKNFHFVVASVHSRFSMDEAQMTARLLRAVENPYTDLLGHPSGRLLLSREPYKFDVKKIIDACAANNVAIEINANPKRLDLDWRWVYYAREKGCLFSINPDAHSVKEIDLIKYGVLIGRKAGLTNAEVINCFNLNRFKKFLNRKVNRKFHGE